MPVLNRIASYAEDMKGWRRHLHMHPELAFDCHETAAWIVARLREFGVDEIHEGIAKTGVVALIKGQKPSRDLGDDAPPARGSAVPTAGTKKDEPKGGEAEGGMEPQPH